MKACTCGDQFQSSQLSLSTYSVSLCRGVSSSSLAYSMHWNARTDRESGGKAGMIMASTRSGRGVRLPGDRVQLLGYRGFLMVAFLSVTLTTFVIEGVHCSITTAAVAPAPTPSTQQSQPIVTFNEHEADALNAVFQNWSKQNPQLSTLLNWSLEQHPCNNLTSAFERTTGNDFPGAWIGVGCTSLVQNRTEIPRHYDIIVTSLQILGSNSTCGGPNFLDQCGFDGIIGQLPPEISNLTNLDTILINNNPRLTGPVPVELFQMPNFVSLNLANNSLSGTLPSDIYNPNCQLKHIYLSNNNFSGSLQVSPQGTLFCSSLLNLNLRNNFLSGTLSANTSNADCQLQYLDLSNNNFSGNLLLSPQGTLFCSSLSYLNVEFNQLDGPIDLQDWNGTSTISLYLNNNSFGGTFFAGPYFDAYMLDLSCNDFTNIQFANFIGSTQSNSSDIRYLPSLSYLNISSNNFSGLFLQEFLQMSVLSTLDLSMNNFWGSIDFRSLNVTTKLNYLNISNNYFNGTFFTGANFNPKIVDLSNNQFNDIAIQVYNDTTPSNGNIYLPSLEKIYFQNNNLSGQFPTIILTAPDLQILDASRNEYQILQLPSLQLDASNLSQVSITNNKLDAVQFPSNGRLSFYNLQFSSVLFLGGNPICNKIRNTVLSSICRLNQTDELRPVVEIVISKSSTKMKVIIATSTSSTLVLVLLIAAIYVWRLMGRIKALHIILEEFDKKEVKPNLYSYREVKLATNNFDKDNKLGEGSFGVVYKGELSDGTQAAVKKLTMSSNQVLSEFLNEVVIISGLKHRNLVKLKGCCLGDGDQRILVFELVENNNLAEALWMHGDLQSNIETPYLDWETRFNIIVGIARGLAYLHEELQPPIIHRDIKATNILLDKNYNAKIADFGLAYLFPTLDNEASHLTLTQIAGTRGYCSPEYAAHGHVSTALDVYSFGILVLEIVSGRKNIDPQKSNEEIYLREWAWKQYEAKASMTLIDQKMEHSPMDLEAIMRVLVVALACVDYKATRRPKMHDVVPMLFGNMSIDQFQTRFEDGDEIAEMSVEFPITLDTISSLSSNENLHANDCVLLSNIGDLEMNSIFR